LLENQKIHLPEGRGPKKDGKAKVRTELLGNQTCFVCEEKQVPENYYLTWTEMQ
jgi:hypothetical protein